MPRLNPHLFATLGTGVDGPTDTELLNRFVAERDAGAFELLVWRHASLVLRVCRSVLRDRHEAEDAAQAAFLALARQAKSIRKTNIAGWLFRVARRVSARSARRLQKQPTTADTDFDQLPAPTPKDVPDPRLERILHEELARLPEKYQLPILLCFFEGHTYTEAAQRLECPIGTIAGRISRAKSLLGVRIAQRGISLAGLVVATTAIPASFARVTATAAKAFAQGNVSIIQKTVLELANREVCGMFTMKAVRCVSVLACGVLVFSFGWAIEPPTAPALRPTTTTQPPATPKSPAPVFGKTFAIVPVTTDLQRRLIAHSPVAIVLIDGAAMFRDSKTLDLDAIDFKGIEKGLAVYQPAAQRAVQFTTNYLTSADLIMPSSTGRDLLDYGWKGLGNKVGFGRSECASNFGFITWGDRIAPLRENTDATAAEMAIGDDRVRAYPVRTPLSRVLTGKVDGVIDVRVELDPRQDDWIPAEVEKSVSAAIAALKLEKGKKLGFYFNLPKREEDLQVQGRVRKVVIRWATDHGLEYEGFSY